MMRWAAHGVLAVASVVAAFSLACEPQSVVSREETGQDSEVASGAVEPSVRGDRRKQSDRFSNITLQTQHGESVRFYDDLVKDRAVVINFVYTTCTKICPGTTAQLAKINDSFGPWIGEAITMLSITIDPDVDDSERLKRYWELFGSKPGWLFLTGDYDEIDGLRRELGVYDLDPVIDADKTQHAGIVTFGNDRTDRWTALPVFMHRRLLAKTILDTTWDDQWKTSARRLPRVERGSDVYSGRGVVREILADRSEVMLTHGDIPGLMMAMTMVFEVADPSLLDGLSVGQSIDFGVELVGEAHRIVSFTVAEPAAQGRETRGVLLSPKRDRVDLQASG